MFSAPLRLLGSLRPTVPAGVLTATAVSTIVFSATPFLIPAISSEWGLRAGVVGLISTIQLLGFVLASWLAPRWFYPRRTVMTVAIAGGVVANLASAAAPNFAMLASTRLVSGVSLGLIAWVSWAEVFGDDDRVGDVAVIGPIVGTIASPVIAAVLQWSSPRSLFIGLAALYLIPAFFVRRMRLSTTVVTRRQRHRPTKAAFTVLAALGLYTCGGSSVFVFAAEIGQRFDNLSGVAVSFAFSLNALAAIPAARFRGDRRLPGFWMAGTAACGFAVAGVHLAPVLFLALGAWGFTFWRGIPGAFKILAERSAYPEERAGDAQAVMAVGRIAGPTIGGVLYTISPFALGIVGGSLMAVAAIVMIYVEWRVHPQTIRDALVPVRPIALRRDSPEHP